MNEKYYEKYGMETYNPYMNDDDFMMFNGQKPHRHSCKCAECIKKRIKRYRR